MKVVFLKPGAKMGLGYHVGEEAEFEAKQAKELIDLGICQEIEETEKVKKKK